MVCCFQEDIKIDRTDLHALRWPLLPLISSVPSHPSDPISAHTGASHLQSTAENIYSKCFMKSTGDCFMKSLRQLIFPVTSLKHIEDFLQKKNNFYFLTANFKNN